MPTFTYGFPRICCRALAMLALLAFASGCGNSGTANDKLAAEWAAQHGGKVLVGDAETEVTSVKDEPEDAFVAVRIDLNRKQPPITDKDLEQLPLAPNIQYVGLYGANVTDKGIDSLKQLRNLKELELSYTNVTDAGLENLASMKELTKLYLYGTPVTEEGRKSFKSKRPDCALYHD